MVDCNALWYIKVYYGILKHNGIFKGSGFRRRAVPTKAESFRSHSLVASFICHPSSLLLSFTKTKLAFRGKPDIAVENHMDKKLDIEDRRRLYIGMLPQIMGNHMEKSIKSERELGLLQGLILIMQCRSQTDCKYYSEVILRYPTPHFHRESRTVRWLLIHIHPCVNQVSISFSV